MKKPLFDDLIKSIKEARVIARKRRMNNFLNELYILFHLFLLIGTMLGLFLSFIFLMCCLVTIIVC